MTRAVPRSGRITHAQILCLLFGVAFLIRILFAQADLFLHNWDERFHALVARNLMHDPFKPMLIANPLAAYDFKDWTGNNIWLHKQPLFLWQMALSMKVFGVSELALRLPSVLTGSLMVVLLFRIAFLLTANTTLSLLAATLLCFSHFHLELIAGIHAMDHNDVALGFYVLASLWAWAEYRRDGRWHWAFLVGAFAGCAILNKWLVGLTVFLGWSVHILSTMRQKNLRRETGHFLLALLVCGAVFVPWQVYIASTWPIEAKYEYDYNNRHLTEAIEGHGGSIWYYAENVPALFGKYVWVLIPVGVGLALASRTIDRSLLRPLLAIVAFVFLFFSLSVKTKINTYVFFVAPLCMIFMATGLSELHRRTGSRVLFVLASCAGVVLSFDPGRTLAYFSASNVERNRRIETTRILKDLKSSLPADVRVVLNTNDLENLDLMFYNNDLTAYRRLSKSEFESLAKQGTAVAAFKSDGRHDLPDYVSAYPLLHVIDRGYAFRDDPY
ncbi:MAG: glycosyltransferase family 39 protein [Thermoanaerobaculia bacterium]|nr:glycosyltransferase family 39 protein [Thermoanaerobaculia bacterium]